MLATRKSPKRKAQRLRSPGRTRERLLQAAFREVYRSGFQSASLDTILASAKSTKGALGHAIIEEVIAKRHREQWLRPLEQSQDPVDTLVGVVRSISVQPEA